MSSHAYAFGNRIFTCVHPTISRMIYKLVGRQLPIAVCRCKWLQGRIYGTVWSHPTCSGLTFNCFIPCQFLSGQTDWHVPDHEAPGHPIEATLFGLLCVRHSASHFVSTHFLARPVGQSASSRWHLRSTMIMFWM